MSKITNLNLPHKLKEVGRHEIGDGLWLKVLDPDKAYWVFRYRANDVEREVSLGSARKVSLAEARKQHTIMRGQVAAGADPRPSKEKPIARATLTEMTFDQAGRDYIAEQERLGTWKNDKHAAQWRSTLASLPPALRSKRVSELGVVDVYDALKPIWERTPETGARLRARIAIVIDSVRGPEDTHANPAAWSGWLKKKLGDWRKLGKLDRKTGERVPRGNHATMFYEAVPAFMARLNGQPGLSALALEFAILTAARTSEAIEAPWSEFDLDAKVWTIPAQRMKMDKAHRVPLSDRAIEILRAREKERAGSAFVFASPPLGRRRTIDDAPLSTMAFLALLKRMQVKVTAHGFRASFKVWAGACAHAEEKTRDRCLAHSTNDPYDQDDRFTQRRPLMQLWADYCAGESDGKIVAFRRPA